MKKTILDLYSGLEGWTAAFKDHGWDIFTIDFEEKFESDLTIDMLNLDNHHLEALLRERDMLPLTAVLASPPCQRFSVAALSKNWGVLRSEKHPRNIETALAIALVAKAYHVVEHFEPTWWIIENPVGMLRTVLGPPRITTYFCAFGDIAYKPTDLWGVIPMPKGGWPKPKEWEPAPRGSHAGTQGKANAAERAKIPYALSEAMCLSMEQEMTIKEEEGNGEKRTT